MEIRDSNTQDPGPRQPGGQGISPGRQMVTQFPLGPHHQILADATCLLFHPPDILGNIRQPLQQAKKGAPRALSSETTGWDLKLPCQVLKTYPPQASQVAHCLWMILDLCP